MWIPIDFMRKSDHNFKEYVPCVRESSEVDILMLTESRPVARDSTWKVSFPDGRTEKCLNLKRKLIFNNLL